jgi:hypothetical protein
MTSNQIQHKILLFLTECQPTQIEVVPELEAVGVMSAVVTKQP